MCDRSNWNPARPHQPYLSFREESALRITPSPTGDRRVSRREGDRGSALDEPELTGGIDRSPPGHEIAQR